MVKLCQRTRRFRFLQALQAVVWRDLPLAARGADVDADADIRFAFCLVTIGEGGKQVCVEIHCASGRSTL